MTKRPSASRKKAARANQKPAEPHSHSPAPSPSPPPENEQEAAQSPADDLSPDLSNERVVLDLLRAWGSAAHDINSQLTEERRLTDPSAPPYSIPLNLMLDALARLYLALVLPHGEKVNPLFTMTWSLNLSRAHLDTIHRQRQAMTDAYKKENKV